METTIYTYVNQRVVLFTRPTFYFLKNQKAFDKLIDKLLDIDAVSSPADLKFPCVLKLEPGFSVNLRKSSVKEYEKTLASVIQKAEKELKTIKPFKR